MNFKNVGSVIAAVAALLAQSAIAQTEAPKARADVKAETAAAKKTPAGEGSPAAATEAKSTKTRAERKAETKDAAKAKELTPAGEGPAAPKK